MTKYIDADACRNEFMEAVYDILTEDSTNDRANEILDVFDAFPAADVESVREWIPCSERLPKVKENVLVAFDDGFVATANIEKDGDWGLWQDSGEVIAWMPLPEPRKVTH